MKRRRRKTQIEGAFAWRLIEMLESPVMQVLNQSEHRALTRLEIELGHHAGTENGKLVVTFKAFKQFGIDPQAVAPSLRALAALGIIERTRQGSGGRTEYHDASEYRLTYRHTDEANPTDDWRSIKTIEDAKRIATVARKAKDRAAVERSLKSAKKEISGVEKPRSPGGKNHPGKSKVPGGDSHRSSPGGDSHPSIYISGRDTAQTAREARPSGRAEASGPSSSDPKTLFAIASLAACEQERTEIVQNRIASRIGSEGWLVLSDMATDELDRLTALERSASLDNITLAEAVRAAVKLRGAA